MLTFSAGPVLATDYHQPLCYSRYGPSVYIQGQMGDGGPHHHGEYLSLLHMDSRSTTDIREIYPHKRDLGSVRKGDIPSRRRGLELSLYAHRQTGPSQTRPP